MQTLSDILSEAGLRPRSMRAGSTTKMLCPKCGGGRTKEHSLSLTIDDDGQGYVAKCHRGSCGWPSSGRVHDESGAAPAPRPRQQTYQPPARIDPNRISVANQLYEFFEKRGLSRETVDKFGVHLVLRHKFPGAMGVHDAIAFPYRLNGELVNRKYRALHTKEVQAQDYQAKPTLFNVDSVTTPDVVVWVEGEPDVMAMDEAGYPQTVSLKDGSGDKLRDEDDPKRLEDKRFFALATHADLLEKVQKFILAGDADGPGGVLREELARRLGRHRCWTVKWPDGCKDANDTLRQHGAERVRECIEAAEPYPIDGVQQVTGAKLDDYLERPAPMVMKTGIASLDKILRLPGEGRLIILTGLPNAGKSTLTMNLMVSLMEAYKRRFGVFSPEMQPFEEFAIQCAEILMRKPARKDRNAPLLPVMDREERVRAGDWLRDRMYFFSSDSEEEPPTLDWILARGRECVLRYGMTDLLIDPFNEIERGEGDGANETQYIGRVLQRCKAFGNRYGCNVWIVAHPRIMRPAKPGEPVPVPGPYDINGSAHWANKADVGLTVHTPKDETEIHLWKTRFRRWGRKGNTAKMTYDASTCRYSSDDDGGEAYRRARDGE